MEINRNQYFLAGVVLLLLGIQLRAVEAYVLNDKATQILNKQANNSQSPDRAMPTLFISSATTVPRKVVRPPTWLGWALISAGAVLILHSLAMKRPG
jgi:hypothetical protein